MIQNLHVTEALEGNFVVFLRLDMVKEVGYAEKNVLNDNYRFNPGGQSDI
jgi:hypothetical protein